MSHTPKSAPGDRVQPTDGGPHGVVLDFHATPDETIIYAVNTGNGRVEHWMESALFPTRNIFTNLSAPS